MSIERNPVPGSHKATAGSEASHGRGKHSGTGTPLDGGGFSSLMLTLGAQDSDPGSSVALVDAAALTDPNQVLNPGLLLAQSAQLAPDSKILDLKGHTNDSSLKPVEMTASDPARSHPPLQTQTGLRGTALEQESEAAQKTALDLATAKDAEAALKIEPEALAQAGKMAHASHKPALAEDGGKQIKGKLDLQALEQKTRLAESVATQTVNSLPQLAQAIGTMESALTASERHKERLALRQIGASESGAWGYQALAEAGRIQAPADVGASASLPPEMLVAEQVNYWIGRDVQNAELRFDGLGEGTVKVHISMQGNEASVEFRSDQPETRQILEGAVAHLKDLLGHEGLVLSSVSVGHSGAGSTDARQARQAQAARTLMREATVPSLTLESAVRTPRASGRAIDLFV